MSRSMNSPNAPAAYGAPEKIRLRLEVRGRVQGVGFRPFAYRIAWETGLAGHVGNDPRGAFIEIEGPREKVALFKERLREKLPPLAEIAAMDVSEMTPLGEIGFHIERSSHEGEQKAEIAPDTATCADCLREMDDPADRRYRYPFINCTNCGPRYSIIRAVPYDRANTTMAVFRMCPACRAEYDDPADRRFHAQPNACPVCGPKVRLTDAQGVEAKGDPIRLAARWLADGRIVAVKGLGGFHLACRADHDGAVKTLRERKGREAKPLAMMAGTAEAARRIVELDEAALAALQSAARPIVLAPKRADAPISAHVAPGSECFGVMLPYAPLHFLLFGEGLGPLVMTSGNPSAEPLCRDNAEALKRLRGVADGFLMHNRDIERRVDDSVVMVIARSDDVPAIRMPLRRSRGYVPAPLVVPISAARPVLAVGGELKSTVCLLHGNEAVVSEHLGDLDNPAAYRNFVGTVACFERLLRLKPEVVACDLHPGYAASRYARELGLPVVDVQHHHAHVAACMAENGLTGKTIGVSCDGTGYGTDGTIWGCEILLADERDFTRPGHLRTFPLPGGDAAATDTWRPAAGLLTETYGAKWPPAAEAAFGRVDIEAIRLVRARLANPSASVVRTSSLGRLFDAVAFLLGVCDRNRCEAEAPMALEALASECAATDPLDWAIESDEDGAMRLDFRPLVRSLVEGIPSGRPSLELARAFHDTIAVALAEVVRRVADASGVRRVALTGGCFANRLLISGLSSILLREGFQVVMHRRLPPGDGGIALGQAVIAAARGQ